jgi:hypothetical protein
MTDRNEVDTKAMIMAFAFVSMAFVSMAFRAFRWLSCFSMAFVLFDVSIRFGNDFRFDAFVSIMRNESQVIFETKAMIKTKSKQKPETKAMIMIETKSKQKPRSNSTGVVSFESAHERKNLESRNEKSWLSFRSWVSSRIMLSFRCGFVSIMAFVSFGEISSVAHGVFCRENIDEPQTKW